MVNCIVGSFVNGTGKHSVQGPRILCEGPVYNKLAFYFDNLILIKEIRQ